MSLISLRLPDALDALLDQEAKASKRAKSEIARTAIADYLQKQTRDRFIADYVRGAMGEDRVELLARAEEFLPLENEALALAEARGKSPHAAAREKAPAYRRGKARRPA